MESRIFLQERNSIRSTILIVRDDGSVDVKPTTSPSSTATLCGQVGDFICHHDGAAHNFLVWDCLRERLKCKVRYEVDPDVSTDTALGFAKNEARRIRLFMILRVGIYLQSKMYVEENDPPRIKCEPKPGPDVGWGPWTPMLATQGFTPSGEYGRFCRGRLYWPGTFQARPAILSLDIETNATTIIRAPGYMDNLPCQSMHLGHGLDGELAACFTVKVKSVGRPHFLYAWRDGIWRGIANFGVHESLSYYVPLLFYYPKETERHMFVVLDKNHKSVVKFMSNRTLDDMEDVWTAQELYTCVPLPPPKKTIGKDMQYGTNRDGEKRERVPGHRSWE